MPTLPTGSASLRGARPRAARVTPGAFESDVQSLVAATTAPLAITESVEQLRARNRERQIAEATFEDRLANAAQAERLQAVRTGQDIAAAEGQQEKRTFEIAGEGRFVETGVVSPTGSFDRRTLEQVATPQQLLREQQERQMEARSAEALAAQRERVADRPNLQVTIQKNEGQLGETISRSIITTDKTTGEIVNAQEIDLGGRPITPTQPAGAAEILSGLQTTPGAPAAPEVIAPEAATAAPAVTAQAAQVTEAGRTFTPTGDDQSGYRRGVVYSLPSGVRVVYTGGDPFDPTSFTPVQ